MFFSSSTNPPSHALSLARLRSRPEKILALRYRAPSARAKQIHRTREANTPWEWRLHEYSGDIWTLRAGSETTIYNAGSWIPPVVELTHGRSRRAVTRILTPSPRHRIVGSFAPRRVEYRFHAMACTRTVSFVPFAVIAPSLISQIRNIEQLGLSFSSRRSSNSEKSVLYRDHWG